MMKEDFDSIKTDANSPYYSNVVVALQSISLGGILSSFTPTLFLKVVSCPLPELRVEYMIGQMLFSERAGDAIRSREHALELKKHFTLAARSKVSE